MYVIFFRTSKVAVYERIWASVSSRPNSMVMNITEGVARVKRGNYIFLGESTSLDYITSRHCDLMKVGGNLNSIGYGLATPIGSELRDRFDINITFSSIKGPYNTNTS